MDVLNVIYVDPLAEHFLVRHEALHRHFERIHSDGATGIVRQAYHQICRMPGENDVLLTFGFAAYQQDVSSKAEIFLS